MVNTVLFIKCLACIATGFKWSSYSRLELTIERLGIQFILYTNSSLQIFGITQETRNIWLDQNKFKVLLKFYQKYFCNTIELNNTTYTYFTRHLFCTENNYEITLLISTTNQIYKI